MGFVRLNKSQIIGNHFNLDMHIENIFKSQNQSHIGKISLIKTNYLYILFNYLHLNLHF